MAVDMNGISLKAGDTVEFTRERMLTCTDLVSRIYPVGTRANVEFVDDIGITLIFDNGKIAFHCATHGVVKIKRIAYAVSNKEDTCTWGKRRCIHGTKRC